EAQFRKRGIPRARLAVLRGRPVERLRITAFGNPRLAYRRETRAQVDGHGRVRVRTGGVIDRDCRILQVAGQRLRRRLADLAHRHADICTRSGDVDSRGVRERPRHFLGEFTGAAGKFLGNGAHRFPLLLLFRLAGAGRREAAIVPTRPLRGLPAQAQPNTICSPFFRLFSPSGRDAMTAAARTPDPEMLREYMVERQVRTWEVLDPKVLDVMRALPRDHFVPARYRGLAYADMQIPLGEGAVMMQPK